MLVFVYLSFLSLTERCWERCEAAVVEEKGETAGVKNAIMMTALRTRAAPDAPTGTKGNHTNARVVNTVGEEYAYGQRCGDELEGLFPVQAER